VHASSSTSTVLFGEFRLDRRRGVLSRKDARGVFVPLSVGSRALAILDLLIQRAEELVSRAEIIGAVWPGRTVEDSNLNVQIATLRRIIDQGRCEGSLIQTIPGHGYRFTAEVTRVDTEERADSASVEVNGAPLLPDKPSIAVLPFTHMSGDPEQEFFADGITEDVITALSRYPSLFVIARNSCFTYKGRAVDVKQVGRELGVRYVLEGSLRKAGNRIRVTAQLVEAESNKHVWAERYDRDLANIFAVQDEITEAATIAIAPAIAEAELQRALRKSPGTLDAWAAYQRGLWHLGKFAGEDNALAEKFFREAIDLDPTFAGGYRGLGYAQFQAAMSGFQKRSLPEVQSSAEALARRAVGLDGADAEARTFLGEMLLYRGDHEGALAEAERALAMTPNLASAHGWRGALTLSGRVDEGLASLRTSIRLDPRDPLLALRLNHLAMGLYLSREYAATIEAARRGIRSNPDFPSTYRWVAAALGQLGRLEEAKLALEKAIAVAPASFDAFVRRRVPWHRPEDYAHMLDGLRKAGWCET
jgi:adenylate cyclase